MLGLHLVSLSTMRSLTIFLQLCNPLLQPLNRRDLNSVCVDHQDSVMQPGQREKLVVSEVATAIITGILMRNDVGTATQAPGSDDYLGIFSVHFRVTMRFLALQYRGLSIILSKLLSKSHLFT